MRRMVTNEQINSLVRAMAESGDLENVKPLYRHSIAIKGTDWTFSILIINNDDTALEDVADLDEALIPYDIIAPIIGCIKVESNILTTNYAIFNENDNDFYLRGMYNDGTIETGSNQVSFRYCINQASFILDDVQKLN